jgi:hypothetical protein
MDVRGTGLTGPFDIFLLNSTGDTEIIEVANGNLNATANSNLIATGVDAQSLTVLDDSVLAYIAALPPTDSVGIAIVGAGPADVAPANAALVADFFSFGFTNDGLENDERIANQLIRLELEESGDNTSIFQGTLEYTMINQLNILDEDTYSGLSTISDEATFIVIEDLDDEESPRVSYLDLGSDGVSTQVSDQEEAPAHSGIVSFDLDTYKTADTVVITLEDLDLNVDSDLIDIYTTVDDVTVVNGVVTGNAVTFAGQDSTLEDVVGSNDNNFVFTNGENLGRVLDVTFDDQIWTGDYGASGCSPGADVDQ